MKRRAFLVALPSLMMTMISTSSKADVIYHPALETKQDLPELWYWSHAGCLPCVQFEREYKELGVGCGFVAIKQEGKRPDWMVHSNPQFWWHIKDKVPTQKDVANTRHQDGYPGWKSFLVKFKNSRNLKTKQAGGPAEIPFVQPDQPNPRAVALNMVYNPSHNCPKCGRYQSQIENGAGPNHTHKCKSCSTVWYHKDT